MFHSRGDINAFGGGTNMKVIDEPQRRTLMKVVRTKISDINMPEFFQEKPPEYKKYASWILPTSKIIKTVEVAKKHAKGDHAYDFRNKNCVEYACYLMERTGIEGINFGMSFKRFGNLKGLIQKGCLNPPPLVYHK
jgi:hypothetical protein